MKQNKTLRAKSVFSQRQKEQSKSVILKKPSWNSQSKFLFKQKHNLNRYDKLKTQYQEYYPVVNESSQFTKDHYQNDHLKNYKNKKNQFRQKEQLQQENISLKKRINKLNQDLTIQKCKNLVQLKDKAKISKQINFQIDYDLLLNSKNQLKLNKNQLHFNPNSYMISAIKQRYDLLKQQYQAKCKQLQNFMNNSQISKISELQAYIFVLEQQNKKLITTIDSILIKKQFLLSNNKYFQANKKNNKLVKNQQDQAKNAQFQFYKQINQVSFENSQLSLQNKILKQRISTSQLQNQELLRKYQQKKRDYENMEKVITLKDNQIYQTSKLFKKMKKEKLNSDLKVKNIQQQINQIKISCKEQIDQINNKSNKIYEIQKKIFQSQITKRDLKISKLQKEISYLSTLLKYWKPLNQIQNQDQKPLSPQKSQIAPSNSSNKNGSVVTSNMLGSIRKRTKTKISTNERNIVDFKLGLHQENFPKGVSEKGSEQSFDPNSSQSNIQIRQPKTSRKKHSEESIKVRKILHHQIQYLKWQLMYRAMGFQVQMKTIKNLFNFKQKKSQTRILRLQKSLEQEQYQDFQVSRQEKIFAKQYITMSQIKDILSKFPFQLQKNQAHLLARYMVQDTTAQHVYCDQNNQIDRNIVKSIISAFIGQYSLTQNNSAIQQWKNILIKYQTNLKLALGSLAPDGTISYNKLFDLFQSIQIQASQNLKNFIVSKLFILPNEKLQKQSLNKLKYNHLFQKCFLQSNSK